MGDLKAAAPRVARRAAAFALLAAAAWAWWSYAHGGLIAILVAGMSDSAGSLELLRGYIRRWGSLGPVVYVVAVVLEVLIAPIPGTLLYAPGGAVFGGFWGGTLSLAGNTIGATLACVIARVFGERLTARLDGSSLQAVAERVRARGLWVIALLRVNPFTSSDLVSYAAGLVRVPTWHVTVGTFIGMAPLCYAQSYFSEQLFRVLPGGALLLVGLGLAYAVVVVAVLMRR